MVIGLVYTVVLFMIVPLVSTLDGMDNSLIEAGYNLGGSRLTVLRRIVIPYAMPGIVAGCIIVFMLTAGSYLTPILLGGKNSSGSPQQIYNQFITRYNWEVGATFGVLLLVFTSLVVWLGLRLTGQSLGDHRGAELSDERRRAADRRAALALPRLCRRLLRLPRRAARGGGDVRLQRLAVPGAAVERLHARLVLRRRASRSSACSTTGGCCRGW